MSGQKHAKVALEIAVTTARRQIDASGKSDEAACEIAFVSAIISLQTRTARFGGDAVIDIKSIVNDNNLDSATNYRCATADGFANVVLTGRIVQLEK